MNVEFDKVILIYYFGTSFGQDTKSKIPKMSFYKRPLSSFTTTIFSYHDAS